VHAVNEAAAESEKVAWPPILGLFMSVVVTLTYLRRNRIEAEIGESFGVSQSTISRAVTALTPLLSTRWRGMYPWLRTCTPMRKQEATQSKIVSLVVKVGAVAMLVLLNPDYALDLQLIAGVIILQTLPLVVIALYTQRDTRWFHPWALLAGWATGMAWGLWMLVSIPNLNTGIAALELGRLSIFGWEPFVGSTLQIYPGLVALGGNLIVATLATPVLRQVQRLAQERVEQERPQPDRSRAETPLPSRRSTPSNF
jgi:Na+/proline symporter